MTDKQPKALKLGDELTATSFESTRWEAAAELRRLHEVNVELVEALGDMIDTYQYEASQYNESLLKAKAALAKAQGENND